MCICFPVYIVELQILCTISLVPAIRLLFYITCTSRGLFHSESPFTHSLMNLENCFGGLIWAMCRRTLTVMNSADTEQDFFLVTLSLDFLCCCGVMPLICLASLSKHAHKNLSKLSTLNYETIFCKSPFCFPLKYSRV